MNLAQRLKPYQVAHHLVHRLEPYNVTTPTVSTFRAASWNTLVWWAMFLDEEEAEMVEREGITV